MKKLLAFILVIVMAFTLCACIDNSPSDTDGNGGFGDNVETSGGDLGESGEGDGGGSNVVPPIQNGGSFDYN